MDDIRTRSRRSTGTPAHQIFQCRICCQINCTDGTTGKFTRQMTAASLSELLKNPDVVLIGVNRDPPVFYPYKRKKGR